MITEDRAGWLAFLRGPVVHRLAATTVVISDAHLGLVHAAASALHDKLCGRMSTAGLLLS
jgi:transposase-like protein